MPKVRVQQDPLEEQEKKTQGQEGQQEEKKEEKQYTPQITKMYNLLSSRYDFRRNRIRQKMEWKEKGDKNPWQEMDDQAEADIVYWLKENGYKKPENDLSTILKSSRIEGFNPVTDYTSTLKLKRVGQLKKLMNAVKLDHNITGEVEGKNYQELFEEYFTKWMMACYKCMTGEKFNDVMFILAGAQGRHKTSFLNFLCPTGLVEYRHTGHIEPSLNNYLTASYLVEKVWINVDDQMENIFGKDYNSMKSIISQDKVSRRMLYAKHSIQQNRIANFCGSVNEMKFLRDSNNRRYLCFAIEDIDVSYSEVDMDSVWAEVKELADAAPSKYIFTQNDFRIIDIMDDEFQSPEEENELLKISFRPTTERGQWVYYMQFNEILNVLRKVGNNPGLKKYNLQTAMRKYGYVPQVVRRPERGKLPLHLYSVKIVEGSMHTSYLQDLCKQYRDPHEWEGQESMDDEMAGLPFA